MITNKIPISTPFQKEEVLQDFYHCVLSRELSISIRKEVLNGKAKFGVSDDGKELFQLALAKVFRKGDFRADYYRGHTLLLAMELATPEEMLAQLYADCENDPFSGGRQMNNHHATAFVDQQGNWLDHKSLYNLSSDISTTAGQMARAIGLAMASKKYKQLQDLKNTPFSRNGEEVVFCIIGDASTSEGAFWEVMNAAGVQQVPLVAIVSDDGYGISVPRKYQTTKDSISIAMAGLEAEKGSNGIDIYRVEGWDYPKLCTVFQQATDSARKFHRPVLIHVDELTQPQGHSTSGSHERYKSKERLQWEKAYDCNHKFEQWILQEGFATPKQLDNIKKEVQQSLKAAKEKAWAAYRKPLKALYQKILPLLKEVVSICKDQVWATQIIQECQGLQNPTRHELVRSARQLLAASKGVSSPARAQLQAFVDQEYALAHNNYHRHLYSETPYSAVSVPAQPAKYSEDSPYMNGYEVLNAYFKTTMKQRPNVLAFGEDVGQIGDVNQGFAGLQEIFGENRLFDTGIREWTIVGYAIGMAMRGLRPIAEIQYLDYLIYALSPLSDDLATLRYRSNNIQAAPAIIRTRGHRLEGIWHSGSPISVLLGALRGICLLVPRNMVQAAGMYNTMLQSDDPAVLIECLNGYRLKERLPDNLDSFTVPLGVPEILIKGNDLTLVTYGSCVRIAQKAIELLERTGISVELIDVQTLLPFDIHQMIQQSVQKTGRIVFLDEDVPGGATAYMMQQVLDVQNAYRWLDSPPRCISAQAHRPPYGSDGDYFSKPNVEDVYEVIFDLVYEADPVRFTHD
ncbi:MAG TPA: thiamine pyrophosphate-dependent enzyme [Saprospiraceae bacterium]|nr:thiamine pyrophosphate-dependent enzyme [Saprospiraceae bacterium]HMQ83661.1 thiamine pyrophosphate-dependent enzyme [Saprospiraceae bacterium]